MMTSFTARVAVGQARLANLDWISLGVFVSPLPVGQPGDDLLG